MCASDMMDWEEKIVVLFVSVMVFKSVGCFSLPPPRLFLLSVVLRLRVRQMLSL